MSFTHSPLQINEQRIQYIMQCCKTNGWPVSPCFVSSAAEACEPLFHIQRYETIGWPVSPSFASSAAKQVSSCFVSSAVKQLRSWPVSPCFISMQRPIALDGLHVASQY